VDDAPGAEGDLSSQREVVDAFLAASREGDFEALVEILDPDVVLRIDTGAMPVGGSSLARGASAVATQSLTFSRSGGGVPKPALINTAARVVWASHTSRFSVAGFTVRGGRIVAKLLEIDVLGC
jgi:RNA polymerase sigma-70 factor (ECF subfamily)